MRLLFISNLYEPFARGGAEIIVKRQIEAAQAAGHEVALLTARPWRSGARFALRQTQEQGIDVFSFYPFNLFFYGDDYKHAFLSRAFWHVLDIGNHHSTMVLRRLLKQWKPDMVISHNLMGLGFGLPAEMRRQGIRHLHVLHDIQLAVPSGLMLSGLEHRWDTDGWPARGYQWVVRYLIGSPDVVVSPSTFLLNFYKKMGYFPQSHTVVLPNPIDDRFFAVHPQPQTHQPLRLTFIGQLAEHKGIRLLMAAFDAMEKERQGELSLVIVGDGVLRAEVEAFAQRHPNVAYKGRMPNAALSDVYKESDLLVMPTLTYENAPTVVFEALASGVPVCVSDIGGAAEAVEDGKNGFVIKAGSADTIKQAITRALAQQKEWPRMREAAKERVKGYDATTIMKRLLEIDR